MTVNLPALLTLFRCPSPQRRDRVRPALLLAVGLLTAACFTSGCVALLAGAGAGATVAYVRGDLDTTLDSGLANSVHAAKKTLAALTYVRISEKEDALQAVLISRGASDQKIELHFAKLTDSATKLKIRVGTFGEESLQNEILVRLRANL
ncbi:MAG: DUF3568 family protein [Opitutae bacterium]|nr:DUF3568 family protein [Opitutae bacterium]